VALELTVIDTTVPIDILRGSEPAIAWVRSLDRRLVASEVTRVEILRGLRSHERGPAERLFAGLRWVGLTEPIARRAGELGRTWRRSHRGVATIDLIIAATTLELDAELATANVRHFPMFPGLEPPYGSAP
jgi:predicted nucleic acid-binding protein